MEPHTIVSREEWIAAQRAHLAHEKAWTHARDELNRKRLALPWVKVEKDYTFDTPRGRQTLADLFDGRSQLLVYHFMFGPDWEEGCPGCSFGMDHTDGALLHLEHHDVSFVAVSRAPLAKLEAFKKRMGWKFRWVSSAQSDFNYDYNVSFTDDQKKAGKVFYNFGVHDFECDEMHGLSAFYKDEDGVVYHTFSRYARGDEPMVGTYAFLDVAPKGRNETNGMMDWMRHHDRYEDDGRQQQNAAAREEGSCCGETSRGK
ncbi:DUF899 domain-containing protein [Paraburkholderia sartisoli]|uniref:Predicted dithiol-disulfide oxidoreductase, DUF899 family n=1 Tax=Paraburkholderia sartisoli TaxID=83784 RepID=A0A1H4ELY9_9BURK|nr:thioredoxin family protein [Paraburkholderia sartisoli]SEA85859.1 Predicted dithiol-disulfide oxidoreductase, DUF899 family [Paraburkholderia sartisoli]